jgi:hypothetical protein
MADKKYREMYIASGLCATCGKVPPIDNRRECDSCKMKRSISQAKSYKSSGLDKYHKKTAKKIENGLCIRCGSNKPVDGKKTCQICLDKVNSYKLSYKDQCYQIYGGYICNCCGETNKMFLTLDHINNDGANDRRSSSSRSNKYERILKEKPELQVLCYNCNCGRYRNGGICPHKNLVSESSLA